MIDWELISEFDLTVNPITSDGNSSSYPFYNLSFSMTPLKTFLHSSEMLFSQWFRSDQKGKQNDTESRAKLMGCQKSILTWKDFRFLRSDANPEKILTQLNSINFQYKAGVFDWKFCNRLLIHNQTIRVYAPFQWQANTLLILEPRERSRGLLTWVKSYTCTCLNVSTVGARV